MWPFSGKGNASPKSRVLKRMKVDDKHPNSIDSTLCAEYFVLVMRFASQAGNPAALKAKADALLGSWSRQHGGVMAETFLEIAESEGDIAFGVKTKNCRHWSEVRDALEILRINCQNSGGTDIS